MVFREPKKNGRKSSPTVTSVYRAHWGRPKQRATLGVRSFCRFKILQPHFARYLMPTYYSLSRYFFVVVGSLTLPKLWNNYFQWWFIFVDILMGSVIGIAFRFGHEDGECVRFLHRMLRWTLVVPCSSRRRRLSTEEYCRSSEIM